MITLKTLHAASLQEIFDHVAKHLLTQNEQAAYRDEDGDLICEYRVFDGKQCAIGCLIADNEYDQALENTGALTLCNALAGKTLSGATNSQVRGVAFEKNWFNAGVSQKQILLLVALQSMHDEYRPDDMYKPQQYIFESGLQDIAEHFELTYDRSKYVS